MPTVFGKLNLKDQNEIVVVNAPASFEPELASLDGVTVRRNAGEVNAIDFSLAFVTKQKELDTLAKSIGKKAQGDAIVWFAYPKQSSKRYTCEFNRDTGWASLGEAGFEPVRMIAIDEDWSALRFRRVGFIKAFTRPQNATLSKEGRQRTRSK